MIRVAVCVPVRNERSSLPALLEALAHQVEAPPNELAVCLYFDSCTDGSAGFVEEAAPALPFTLQCERSKGFSPPNAGRARRAALAIGERLLSGFDDGVLLTTDADSVPAADWVFCARRALGDADLVAGRILRRAGGADPVQSRVEAYYDRLYAFRRAIDPVPWESRPTHHFTGGANLGFRASAYASLGGFSEQPWGEDALIVDDASRAGLRVSRDASVRVETSSRRVGRAAGGLALALSSQDRGGLDAIAVSHPRSCAWQYRAQALARGSYSRLASASVAALLADRLGLPAEHIEGVAAQCPNAEAFAMRIVPAAPGDAPLVTLGEAEHALDLLAREIGEQAA